MSAVSATTESEPRRWRRRVWSGLERPAPVARSRWREKRSSETPWSPRPRGRRAGLPWRWRRRRIRDCHRHTHTRCGDCEATGEQGARDDLLDLHLRISPSVGRCGDPLMRRRGARLIGWAAVTTAPGVPTRAGPVGAVARPEAGPTAASHRAGAAAPTPWAAAGADPTQTAVAPSSRPVAAEGAGDPSPAAEEVPAGRRSRLR